jgi:hypothetical protein
LELIIKIWQFGLFFPLKSGEFGPLLPWKILCIGQNLAKFRHKKETLLPLSKWMAWYFVTSTLCCYHKTKVGAGWTDGRTSSIGRTKSLVRSPKARAPPSCFVCFAPAVAGTPSRHGVLSFSLHSLVGFSTTGVPGLLILRSLRMPPWIRGFEIWTTVAKFWLWF